MALSLIPSNDCLWHKDPLCDVGPNHLSFNDQDMVPIVYHRQADKIGYPQEFSCPGAAVSKVSHVEFAAAKRQFGKAVSPKILLPR